ncbi:DUF317 domain-containing protein [Streptomyces sp. NPDC057596]|uniref:DUF317 domain-containing protein n=1 Tax=Streptomyces sp. NPDC057596 TaxID=3346178 RepID=UPI0036BC8BB1
MAGRLGGDRPCPDSEGPSSPPRRSRPGGSPYDLALPFDRNWTLHQPGEGAAYATSPCLRLWTRFLPEPGTRGKGARTVGANRAPFGRTAWQITFDATTPAELLHDVHTELLDRHLEDRYSDQGHLFEEATASPEARTPLLARSWSHSIKRTARRPSSHRRASTACDTAAIAQMCISGVPRTAYAGRRASFR